MSLIGKLPYFYANDIDTTIQNSLELEANTVHDEVDNTLDQFFVDDCTWGLNYWENMLGIKKNNFDVQTRRENIKAKMRSRGTTTIKLIKSVCEAYSNGEVNVIVNHANYSFVIDFVGSVGIPIAFAEMDNAIVEIKPCHLAHSYKFNYNTHANLSKFTHEQLANYTHEELRTSPELRGENNG